MDAKTGTSGGSDRSELLIAELNHRVRNILALIRGVVRLSAESATTVEAYRHDLDRRIQALARAHDRITAEEWGPASLARLVADEASAYLGAQASRIAIVGPDAMLEPRCFATIALVVHELMTNSAKYGALSVAAGRVELRLQFETEGGLEVLWTEHGGPPVRPPERRGFGRTVIERTIPHDLDGAAELRFEPDGVRARFAIPAACVRAPGAASPAAEERSEHAERAFGAPPADVLLVEDNVIIALDAEDILRRAGVGVVRIAATAAQALAAIAEQPPAFALLDVELGGETSFPVADALVERGLAFAFATGYGESIAFPPRFANAPRLRKPYAAAAILAALPRR